ncbi:MULTISPECIES: hypothetical protein [unclassified Streptomyces]|uniref:hypothetical protein n=1 Tax=unclassified Streptomyces TaxID=2593676 RepID=UPI002DDBFA64|nr:MULTISPECIES: hypothetical protein [unclassified Streptomyces]WSA90358.1 hypothetical protein OIE63_01540 [Streptomyces sp. NBC_01795]WSB74584.1 hypothetical protein OHB04_01535 [Streptomyces sp. NBC_01775]WSS17031.1 hypothetical protein OG533_37860 [Streptomyces sp. NBC_01186]WSS45774.1 hypothetical protein OG220_38115 [Streptomyces sp. NBC_01187]
MKSEMTRRARAFTVLAALATALVGVTPMSAIAGDGPDHGHKRGYVCDKLERTHHNGAVGSGHCREHKAPRHGKIRGTFTIESRWHHHHKVICVAKGWRDSGYANTPKWVKGTHCHRG